MLQYLLAETSASTTEQRTIEGYGQDSPDPITHPISRKSLAGISTGESRGRAPDREDESESRGRSLVRAASRSLSRTRDATREVCEAVHQMRRRSGSVHRAKQVRQISPPLQNPRAPVQLKSPTPPKTAPPVTESLRRRLKKRNQLIKTRRGRSDSSVRTSEQISNETQVQRFAEKAQQAARASSCNPTNRKIGPKLTEWSHSMPNKKWTMSDESQLRTSAPVQPPKEKSQAQDPQPYIALNSLHDAMQLKPQSLFHNFQANASRSRSPTEDGDSPIDPWEAPGTSHQRFESLEQGVPEREIREQSSSEPRKVGRGHIYLTKSNRPLKATQQTQPSSSYGIVGKLRSSASAIFARFRKRDEGQSDSENHVKRNIPPSRKEADQWRKSAPTDSLQVPAVSRLRMSFEERVLHRTRPVSGNHSPKIIPLGLEHGAQFGNLTLTDKLNVPAALSPRTLSIHQRIFRRKSPDLENPPNTPLSSKHAEQAVDSISSAKLNVPVSSERRLSLQERIFRPKTPAPEDQPPVSTG